MAKQVSIKINEPNKLEQGINALRSRSMNDGNLFFIFILS